MTDIYSNWSLCCFTIREPVNPVSSSSGPSIFHWIRSVSLGRVFFFWGLVKFTVSVIRWRQPFALYYRPEWILRSIGIYGGLISIHINEIVKFHVAITVSCGNPLCFFFLSFKMYSRKRNVHLNSVYDKESDSVWIPRQLLALTLVVLFFFSFAVVPVFYYPEKK